MNVSKYESIKAPLYPTSKPRTISSMRVGFRYREKSNPRQMRNRGKPTIKGFAPHVTFKGQLDIKAKIKLRPKA